MTANRPFLERLKVSGYKSIREAEIEFTKLNVLVGANGAGKSNLVSFFSLLTAALNEKLDDYVGRHGGPNALLHFGAQRTREIAVAATVRTMEGTGVLYQRLGFRPPDRLFYSSQHEPLAGPSGLVFGDECAVVQTPREGKPYPDEDIYHGLKNGLATYHLADTSLTSPIRTEGYIEDNRRLNSNGSNLAAVLYRYKRTKEKVYRRIRSTVRKIVPAFDDFVLEPRELNPRNILLNWRQFGQDYVFGPHQFSDGALRAVALITVFQPPEPLPNLVVVDEPELGLHPHAMLIISGLMRAASSQTQVLLATQSPAFLDHFNPDEVIVAEEKEQASHYRRVTADELREWLQQYSLGELWQKNVLGGGPMPVKELYVFCEGPTEQGFCKQVLERHLLQFDCCIHTIKIAHSRHHGIIARGGIGKYETLRFDIQSTIKRRKQIQGVFFTSMIDLYGLPSDFPGKAKHDRNPHNPRPYCEALEQAFGADIGDARFVAHLQLHEYETLLYADPEAFAFSFDDCDGAIAALKGIVAEFQDIERINDSELTAPSKRIIALLEAYEGKKPDAGPDIAEYIGLHVLRQHCAHFSHWISRLETLLHGP